MTADEYDPPTIAAGVRNFGRNNDQPRTGKRDARARGDVVVRGVRKRDQRLPGSSHQLSPFI